MRRRLGLIFNYIKNGHELITILLVYLAIGGFRLGGPDLKATYEVHALAPAAGLKTAIEMKLPGATHREKLRANMERFIASPNLMRIELENTTHSRITDVEISISGVADIVDAAVSSSSSAVNAQAALFATYEIKDHMVTFPKVTEIPPRARITIFVWGKVAPPLFDDAIRVEAAVPRVQVVERQALSGFGLFVARNVATITFVFVAYFLATAMARVRRADERDAERT